MFRHILRTAECGMCGYKTRLESRFNQHVKEFPNCVFTEQSYLYLEQQNPNEVKQE